MDFSNILRGIAFAILVGAGVLMLFIGFLQWVLCNRQDPRAVEQSGCLAILAGCALITVAVKVL